MYLDDFSPLKAHVGYGALGLRGKLGYEGKRVRVAGKLYEHALSTHPPARLLFRLDGRFSRFRCQVAINDDVRAGISHADFTVIADGRQVAGSHHVVAGQPPRELSANISGAQLLELVVRTSRWAHCHAVWLEPQVDKSQTSQKSPDSTINESKTLLDCLQRTEITLPATPPRAKRCIATIVSPGFESWLDDMLGSLYANGACQDALVVVLAIGESKACEQVIAKYQATAIRCRPHARVNATVKSALYSVARVVDAQQFICLDADMLVLGDLRPVFAALEACPEGSILACREGNGRGFTNLQHILCTAYAGQESDLKRLLDTPNGEGAYPLVVNDGLFAGRRTALLALDGAIRAMPQAPAWTDERRDIWWRNQFVFNLALARLQCGMELDATYNLQLHAHDVQ